MSDIKQKVVAFAAKTLASLADLVDKTPYQIMREKQKNLIEAQKAAAQERAENFKQQMFKDKPLLTEEKKELLEKRKKERNFSSSISSSNTVTQNNHTSPYNHSYSYSSSSSSSCSSSSSDSGSSSSSSGCD